MAVAGDQRPVEQQPLHQRQEDAERHRERAGDDDLGELESVRAQVRPGQRQEAPRPARRPRRRPGLARQRPAPLLLQLGERAPVGGGRRRVRVGARRQPPQEGAQALGAVRADQVADEGDRGQVGHAARRACRARRTEEQRGHGGQLARLQPPLDRGRGQGGVEPLRHRAQQAVDEHGRPGTLRADRQRQQHQQQRPLQAGAGRVGAVDLVDLQPPGQRVASPRQQRARALRVLQQLRQVDLDRAHPLRLRVHAEQPGERAVRPLQPVPDPGEALLGERPRRDVQPEVRRVLAAIDGRHRRSLREGEQGGAVIGERPDRRVRAEPGDWQACRVAR